MWSSTWMPSITSLEAWHPGRELVAGGEPMRSFAFLLTLLSQGHTEDLGTAWVIKLTSESCKDTDYHPALRPPTSAPQVHHACVPQPQWPNHDVFPATTAPFEPSKSDWEQPSWSNGSITSTGVGCGYISLWLWVKLRR